MSSEYYVEIDEDSEKIVLPSDKRKTHRKRKSKTKVKWIFIFTFVLFIYLFYNRFILFFLDFLKSNPTLHLFYLYIQSQISNNTLQGLFFVAVLGSIFFLVLPSEALFLYYLNSTEYNFILIIVIMIFGNLLGLIFNYVFGFILGERLLKVIFSEKKFYDYKEKIDNYGGYFLFFGNILPGPIEVLAVFFGGFRFEFKRYIFLSFMGRLIKYILIFILFYFFWDSIIFYYEQIINSLLVLKDFYILD